MSQDTNHIEELFRSKLQNLESPVDSQMWQSIQAGLQANTTLPESNITGKAGFSGISKGLIIASAVVGVGVATWMGVQSSDVEPFALKQELAESKPVEVKNDVDDNIDKQIVTEEIKYSTVKYSYIEKELREIDNFVEIIGEGIAASAIAEPVKATAPVVISLDAETALHNVDSDVKTVEKSVGESSVSTNSSTLRVDNSKNVQFNRLPNVFLLSHSGDFTIEFTGEFKDFSISILDQDQNAIYSSDDPSFSWTGEDKFGQKVSPGNYLYLIIGTDVNNNKIQRFQSLKVLP